MAAIDLTWSAEPMPGCLMNGAPRRRNLAEWTPQDMDFVATAIREQAIVCRRKISAGIEAVLPLEIVRKGPLKLAQFPGASHANGNFVPLRRDSTLAAADIEAMIAALRQGPARH